MAKRNSFTPDLDSDAKRLTRLAVYRQARRLIRDKPKILILPGQAPKHEIDLGKRLLNAHITAVDSDTEAVVAAKEAGADIVRSGDVADLDQSFRYDFINLDTCQMVTSAGMAAVIEAAFYYGKIVATWFSYGHEAEWVEDEDGKKSPKAGLTEHLEQRDLEQRKMLGVDQAFVDVPLVLSKRITHIWREALALTRKSSHRWSKDDHVLAMQPRHVWRYTGNAMPMLAVLWVPFDRTDKVKFSNVDGKAYQRQLFDEESLDDEDLAVFYGCTRRQLAAWKAVKTMRERKILKTMPHVEDSPPHEDRDKMPERGCAHVMMLRQTTKTLIPFGIAGKMHEVIFDGEKFSTSG